MVRKDVNQLDVEQQEWKINFTDYIKNMVTNKTNVTTTASTRQGSKSQRKRLLQAIQREMVTDTRSLDGENSE
jgi:hypothetical protein